MYAMVEHNLPRRVSPYYRRTTPHLWSADYFDKEYGSAQPCRRRKHTVYSRLGNYRFHAQGTGHFLVVSSFVLPVHAPPCRGTNWTQTLGTKQPRLTHKFIFRWNKFRSDSQQFNVLADILRYMLRFRGADGLPWWSYSWLLAIISCVCSVEMCACGYCFVWY